MLKIESIKFPFVALLLMFFLGLCGLIYLTTWMHTLRLSMEYPVYAEMAVVILFSGGIALGGFIAGKYSDKVTLPLRIFSILSFISSIVVLFSPWFLSIINPLFAYLYDNYSHSGFLFQSFRIFLLSMPLLFPACLIGAAMILLASNANRFGSGVGSSVGFVYSAGGFGAFVGLFLSGLVLHPILGYQSTMVLAVTLNTIIALSVFAATYNFTLSMEKENVIAEDNNFTEINKYSLSKLGQKVFIPFVILLLAFISMSFHVILFRTMMLLSAQHIHSFTFIFCLFAFGLSVGSFISSIYVDRINKLLLALSTLVGLFTISVLILISVVSVSASTIAIFIESSKNFLSINSLLFFITSIGFMLPSIFLGYSLPIVVRLQVLDKVVGLNMSYLTICSVFGASIGLFFAVKILMPIFGLMYSLKFIAFLGMLLFIFMIFKSEFKMGQKYIVVVTIIILLPPIFVASPSWNKLSNSTAILNASNNYFDDDATAKSLFDYIDKKTGLVFYHEGAFSTVAVIKDGSGMTYLIVDGAIEATTDKKELIIHDLLVHVALMLHGSVDDVLMVGLGSGASLEATVSHNVKSVDMVELSEDIIESSKYFRSVNEESILDWRVNVVNADGRFYIEHKPKKYDLIVSSLARPYMYSSRGYFTEEYFKSAAGALKSGGLFTQWIDGGQMSEASFKVAIKTFLQAFPFAQLWEAKKEQKQYLLIGSADRLSIDYNVLKERLDIESSLHSLGDIGITKFSTLLNYFIADGGGLRNYSWDSVVNTDDNNYLGFFGRGESDDTNTFSKLEDFRVPPFLLLDNIPEFIYEDMVDTYLSFLLIRDAEKLLNEGRTTLFDINMERLINIGGHDSDILFALSDVYLHAGNLLAKGKIKRAIDYYEESVELNSNNGSAYYYLGLAYINDGNNKKAFNALDKAIEIDGSSPRIHFALSNLYYKIGDRVASEKEYLLSQKLLTAIDENL